MIDIIIDINQMFRKHFKCFWEKKSTFWHRPQLFLQILNSSNFLRYDLL